MRALLIALVAVGAATSPAAAQSHQDHGVAQTNPPNAATDHAGSDHGGHAPESAGAHDGHAGRHDHDGHRAHGAEAPPGADSHAEHGALGVDPHSGGTALPAGDAAPPPVPNNWYADRSFDPAEMAAARAAERRAHGGGTYSQVIIDLAEYRATGNGGS